jgi:hypothetical protein
VDWRGILRCSHSSVHVIVSSGKTVKTEHASFTTSFVYSDLFDGIFCRRHCCKNLEDVITILIFIITHHVCRIHQSRSTLSGGGTVSSVGTEIVGFDRRVIIVTQRDLRRHTCPRKIVVDGLSLCPHFSFPDTLLPFLFGPVRLRLDTFRTTRS